jgi:phosphatidylserine/phosphatidylglycerophosphate/cardiolipin synthase-like enzyme
VQVASTYPCSHPPAFEPQGSFTPLNAFLNAIEKARKYIYIEDQYATPYPYEGPDPETGRGDTVCILTALRAALRNIDYLLIVVPNFTDQPHNRSMRRQFIKALRAVAADKVHVFYLDEGYGTRPEPGEVADEGGCANCSGSPRSRHQTEIYVHSKLWIVDDICAKIGSANCNRRSFTHDSELDLIMVDGAVSNGARSFAQNLRLQLWGEHLRMENDPRLEDHKVALSFWLANAGRVRPYQEDIPDEFSMTGIFSWEQADPEGRCNIPPC